MSGHGGTAGPAAEMVRCRARPEDSWRPEPSQQARTTTDPRRWTMARLIYLSLTSVDGFIEDETGRFDRAVPSAESPRHPGLDAVANQSVGCTPQQAGSRWSASALGRRHVLAARPGAGTSRRRELRATRGFRPSLRRPRPTARRLQSASTRPGGVPGPTRGCRHVACAAFLLVCNRTCNSVQRKQGETA